MTPFERAICLFCSSAQPEIKIGSGELNPKTENRPLRTRLCFAQSYTEATFWVYDGALSPEDKMAKKSKLSQVAVRIGSAMGRADRKAHQVAKAGVLAKKELQDISKQVDALKRQLLKTTKRLKNALS
jgi:hypothetical protein